MSEAGYRDEKEREAPLEGYFGPLPRPRKTGGLNLKFLFLLIAGAVAAVAVAWFALSDRYTVDPNANVPIIRADFGPVKVRPASPGGMTVPDRDKLVYDRMKGDGERPVVERLLPPSEVPLPPPAPTRDPGPTPGPTLGPTADIPVVVPEEEPRPAPPTVAEEVIVLRKVEPAKSPPAEPKALAPAKEEAAAVKLTPILVPSPAPQGVKKGAGGSYLIQLAAARSDKLARDEWKRLQAKYGDILGQFTATVTRVDLGAEKGIFYRLRTGPFATKAEARSLCATLVKRKARCLVVKPKG